ncbi:hypothetical protein GCM10017687_39900 [Streptomyces echinatus]
MGPVPAAAAPAITRATSSTPKCGASAVPTLAAENSTSATTRTVARSRRSETRPAKGEATTYAIEKAVTSSPEPAVETPNDAAMCGSSGATTKRSVPTRNCVSQASATTPADSPGTVSCAGSARAECMIRR